MLRVKKQLVTTQSIKKKKKPAMTIIRNKSSRSWPGLPNFKNSSGVLSKTDD